MYVAIRFLFLFGLAACATGGSGAPDGGGTTGQDAAAIKDGPRPDGPGTPSDAPVMDAPPPADSPPPPDSGGSLFCSNNAMCTTQGECCVTLGGPMGFCAPGDVVLGVCFPN
jgi:hypothetical protein